MYSAVVSKAKEIIIKRQETARTCARKWKKLKAHVKEVSRQLADDVTDTGLPPSYSAAAGGGEGGSPGADGDEGAAV
eukprot:8831774-Pyramimonas_sp.AAC.1